MLKRIMIIEDFFDHLNVNRKGEEFDAIVVNDAHGSSHATIDVGAEFSFGVSNTVDMRPCFEVVAENDAYNSANLMEELELVSKQRDEIAEDADKLEKELKHLKSANNKTQREYFKEGYVVVPAEYLDKELADEFKDSPEYVITAKELVAMCTSAQMEINKGDNRPTSLNVKLYTIMSNFAETEIDKMIKAGKAN